jgi:serine/threonine-protein kinase
VLESGIGDVLAIQEKISGAIVHALPVDRVGLPPVRRPLGGLEKPELHGRYLKARYHVNRRTAEGLVKAIEYFESLIAEHPDHARAYAGLAEAFALRAWYGHAPPNEVMPKAKAAAVKAVKAAPRLSEAHLAAGLVSELYDWDWQKARQSLRLAVDLNPGSATTLFEYGFFLSRMGELDAAFVTMRRAQELDPLSPVINTNLGVNYYYQRRYDAAIHQYLEALEIEPGYQPGYYRLAIAHLQRGAPEEARVCLEDAMGRGVPGPRLKALWAYALARTGRPDGAAQIRDELLACRRERYISPVSIALLFLGMKDTRSTFDWLERAWEEHDVFLVDLGIDPLYDSLRSLPEFRGLLAKMNFAARYPTA